jgi:Zn-dependent alcohol dehydrogenase
MINLGTTGGHFARLAVLLLCGAGTVAAQTAGEKLPEAKRLPVLAWLGPPAEQSTAERMQELADTGFTESFSHYPTVDSARGALDAAQTAGVKLWIALPALRREPESTVPQL